MIEMSRIETEPYTQSLVFLSTSSCPIKRFVCVFVTVLPSLSNKPTDTNSFELPTKNKNALKRL